MHKKCSTLVSLSSTYCLKMPSDVRQALLDANLSRDELEGYGIWEDRKGNRTHVSQMTTSHLENVLKFTKLGTKIHQFVLDELVDREMESEYQFFMAWITKFT